MPSSKRSSPSRAPSAQHPRGGQRPRSGPATGHSLVDQVALLLTQLRQSPQPADALLAAHFKQHRNLGPRERGAISEACFAVLRERNWFTHLAKDGPGEAAGRTRRLALLALAHTGAGVAGATPEEAVWLQQAQATAQPANLDDPMRHNLPQWLAQRLQAQLGDEAWPLAQALLTPAPLDVRVNIAKAKRSALAVSLAADGFENDSTPYSPWGLRMQGKPRLTQSDAFRQGEIEVQDEGSQLLALLVDARRGDMVADFCAGAGGKTLAMAAMMRDQGRVYAFDTSTHRLEGLQPRALRAGVRNLYPIAIAHEADERLKTLAGKMDRVLVDAPCTGLGTLRRSPDRKWRLSEAEADQYPELQARILTAAARLVKPGGRLVYATCSLLREENEDLARAFAAAHRDFEPVPVAEVLAKAKVAQAEALTHSLGPSRVEATVAAADEAASEPATASRLAPSPYLRLWPQRHGTDGFFAAVWQRRR
ncbi:hypothetical protein CCO03_06190 [Comamonas serinivorans]|uniref:SAM-dependent MTase RsmB/NOP-type domain-containing protein n=1 Tax=Comamonas serinivorans TaxID=1082851 RepID=A0A1Y0ELN7_9BURK|nr:RsmB/NOP family class I SAM-dependent RNA methyltransferase [Comamonas serinivorans]ARU04318.1 hypothetical protein CCO03_06190 [Comamonas serinivorans]